MSATQKELQEIYLGALSDYKTEVDKDGDVTFRHPDFGYFYIRIDHERDPEFFQMVFPNFADDKSLGLDKQELLDLANKVNFSNKAAKMTVRPKDDIWNVSAQVEAFIAKPDAMPDAELVRAIIPRSISAIRAAVTKFITDAKEQKSGSSDSAPESI